MVRICCDACGEDCTDHPKRINVPCHLWNGAKVDDGGCYIEAGTGQPVSGRCDSVDVCTRCWNEIHTAAVNKIVEIQKDNIVYG